MLLLFISECIDQHAQVDKELGREYVVMHAYSVSEAVRLVKIAHDPIGCVLFSGKMLSQISQVKAKTKTRYVVYSNIGLGKLKAELRSN